MKSSATIGVDQLCYILSFDEKVIDIADPDPANAEDDAGAVFRQGLALGGAQFMGLEGLALQDGVAYFVASEAGDAEKSQVWGFTPAGDGGTLKLPYESTDGSVLDQPDNITVSPQGAVVMCEDGNGEDVDGGDNWLGVLTAQAKVFDFAQNLKMANVSPGYRGSAAPSRELRFRKVRRWAPLRAPTLSVRSMAISREGRSVFTCARPAHGRG